MLCYNILFLEAGAVEAVVEEHVMKKLPGRAIVRVMLIGLSSLGSGSVLAQVSQVTGGDMESVVVTGTRQAYQGEFERLETPLAEQTLDLATIEAAGALDFITALDLSASVARQNNFGGLWNSFAVRGFVGDENLPSNYLVNGFNAGRGFAGPRDISGIEAIEVLKGPKAALFGRGEPGGTVNVVTKRPDFERASSVRLSAGRFDALRAEADLNLPVSDTLAVRLVGFVEDAESFRDTIETERRGFTPSVLWQVNTDTQLVYELEYTSQEIPFDRGVVAIGNDLGAIDIETFLGEPGNGPMEADVVGHQFELQHELNDSWSALFGFNYRDTSLEGFDTAATLSGGRQFLFRDGQNLSRERRFRDYDAEYYVLRGEFSGDVEIGNLGHRIVFGLDYDEFKNDQVFLRARGGGIQAGEVATDPAVAERLQVINVFNPQYGQFALPTPSPLTDRLDTANSLGFFIQDQITVTEQLDIRVGFRYDEYNQERLNRRNGSETDSSDSRVSPQLGVVYRLNDETAIYAAYGQGFRPLLGNEPNGDPLDPNITKSYELGVKFALLDGALEGTASLFRINQENILAVTPAFEPTTVGEAESTGFELDISGALTESLDLWFSYAHVDVETEKDFFDANFGVTIPSGTDLVNVPEDQVSLQLVNSFESRGLSLTIGGGVLYVGERSGQFGDYFGQGDFDLPDYTTLRAFANYAVNEQLNLRLDVENITDEEIYLNSFASLWVQPGAPRSYRLSIGYAF